MGKGEYDNKDTVVVQPGYDQAGYNGYNQPAQGYAQPAGQPGYGQPAGYGQPGVPYSTNQTTVVVQQQTEERESMVGPIVLSCVVFWLCNCLFGCIGFFIAIGGLNAHSRAEGRSLAKASYGVSIAGIVISVIIVIVIVALWATGAAFVTQGIADAYDACASYGYSC